MYIMPYQSILLCDCLPTSISVVQNTIGSFPGLVFFVTYVYVQNVTMLVKGGGGLS